MARGGEGDWGVRSASAACNAVEDLFRPGRQPAGGAAARPLAWTTDTSEERSGTEDATSTTLEATGEGRGGQRGGVTSAAEGRVRSARSHAEHLPQLHKTTPNTVQPALRSFRHPRAPNDREPQRAMSASSDTAFIFASVIGGSQEGMVGEGRDGSGQGGEGSGLRKKCDSSGGTCGSVATR